jgi:ribonuclease Z
MHLDDFLERADRFQNELLICGHLSTRYHPQEVRRVVEARLPASLRDRLKLWI